MGYAKFLSVFVMFLGLIFLSPNVVYGGAAVTAPSLQQHIYNVTEIDSPSPYHITLVVRTGLNTEYVWIQRGDGGKDSGLLVSYGTYQQVWQISHMTANSGANSIIINANHAIISDEYLVSRIFQIGYIENLNPINGNRSTRPITQTYRPQSYSQAEINHIITVSNRGQGAQSVSTSTTATWHGINVIGDEQFVRRTLQAMEAVERGPLWAYEYVITYLDYVKQHSNPTRPRAGGHINVRTRTFYVYRVTYTGNTMWYASALVHEAVHARQFREYLESYGDRPPRRITFFSTFEEQMRIEMEALDIQIRFLEDAGASRHLIDMARSLIGTVWW